MRTAASCGHYVVLFFALFTLFPPASAVAATPEAFWTRCATNSEADVQCSGPRGIAISPVDGHVFVADSFRQRVVEFDAWGVFVRTFGWKVNKTKVLAGAPEAEQNVCPFDPGDECQAGSTGTGAGQFGAFISPQGIAVDSVGDVYVLDGGLPSNQRVQKFDSEGHFLRMWGKGVNKGTDANKEICTNAGPPAEECGIGGEGTGPGQFGTLSFVGNYIAIDTLGTASAADDKVYVGDQGRIQRFNGNGEFQAEIPTPGKTVRAVAVDPSGNVYAAFCGINCATGTAAEANVRKWNAAAVEQPVVTVLDPQGLASGPSGDLYAIDGASTPMIRAFEPTGVQAFEEETTPPFFPTYPFNSGLATSTGIATGSACWTPPDYDLYLSNSVEAPNGFMRAFGPPPDDAHILLCPPPPNPPKIEEQWANLVEVDRALVQAQINPEFWKDTSYYVQYATAACIEEEPLGWEAGCVKEKPAPPGALLGAGAIGTGADTAPIELTGLTPATEYRYRFAAQSRFDHNGAEVNPKGDPVFGKGGTEGSDGEEAAITTPAIPVPPPPDSCINAPFRGGASAHLPDCRAYEMVSPVDKNGGNIENGKLGGSYNQASPDGNRITYAAAPTFAEQPSSKLYNQYLAARHEESPGEGGWSNHGVNAPLNRQLAVIQLIDREVAMFSPDLCSEWLVDYNQTPLRPEGQEGYVNLYRQDLCGGGSFEALTRTKPAEGAAPTKYVNKDSVQGFSADQSKVFFTSAAGLLEPPEAATGNKAQIYEYSGGELHLVSVRPDGVADKPATGAGDAVGGGVAGDFGGRLTHAVSEDGSRVFWTSGLAYSTGQISGKLYLREHPEQGIVGGECSDDQVACTIEVSSGEKATFWGATADGGTALFSEGKLDSAEEVGGGGLGQATLYRFDVKTKTSSEVASGVRGVLGASEDLSRVYFVSTDDLTGGEENEFEDEATAGEPNLYLEEEGKGAPTYIGTLLGGPHGDSAEQLGEKLVYSIASFNPFYNAARVTPDGARIVFESRARLTHYDNTDKNSGKADVEVFTYAAGGSLFCVSCNPTGARPEGHELFKSYGSPRLPSTGIWGAAWIPASEHPLDSSNVLSRDGGRIFFMSHDPWVAGDTNGAQDVYEWAAAGEGPPQARCGKASAAYHEANGGCVYLISTGESPFESEFWDASPDGRDVFFTTESSLVPQDPGNVDLYDAREGGGFKAPTKTTVCEGEACQSPPGAPNDPTPASSAYEASEPKPRCRKGKVRRKGRCVAKKQRKGAKHHKAAKKRAASNNRGARR